LGFLSPLLHPVAARKQAGPQFKLAKAGMQAARVQGAELVASFRLQARLAVAQRLVSAVSAARPLNLGAVPAPTKAEDRPLLGNLAQGPRGLC
jgi:hypothetical protein